MTRKGVKILQGASTDPVLLHGILCPNSVSLSQNNAFLQPPHTTAPVSATLPTDLMQCQGGRPKGEVEGQSSTDFQVLYANHLTAWRWSQHSVGMNPLGNFPISGCWIEPMFTIYKHNLKISCSIYNSTIFLPLFCFVVYLIHISCWIFFCFYFGAPFWCWCWALQH